MSDTLPPKDSPFWQIARSDVSLEALARSLW